MFTKETADNWIAEHSAEPVQIFQKVHNKSPKKMHHNVIAQNLIFSLDSVSLDGLYCEFGVRDGWSFDIIKKNMKNKSMLHGFDCWDGLPESWKLSKMHEAGILKTINIPKNTESSTYWSGLFSNTIPQFKVQHSKQLAFCHIDGDLYSSACDVLYGLNDQIVPNTILVFDELHTFETADLAKWSNLWNHELKALAEWCETNKRRVQMISRTDWMQATFKVLI